MLRNDAVYSPEMKSRRSPVSRRFLFDFWDLLAVIVVIALVVHIWPVQQADSDHRRDQTASLESSQRAAQPIAIAIDSTETNSRTSVRYRMDSSYAPQAEPVGMLSAHGQSGAANKAIDRLASLQQRPDWTLMNSEIAQARQDLDMLVELGDVAIPEIRSYLQNTSGIDATADGAIEGIGFGSLRLALFDVLRRIGSSQAEAIWYDELRRNQTPAEIEALGHYLSQASPGFYDYDILRKAQSTFSQIADESIEPQDAGPLFRVFNSYGDAGLVSDLENVSQLRWGKYGAVTLARLPAGAGIGSLSRWAEEGPAGNTSSDFALRILAQSAEYPEAGETLINSVVSDRISDANWPEFAQLIAGTYHIQLDPPRDGVTSRQEGAPNSNIVKTTEYIALTPGGGQVLYGLYTWKPVLTPEQVVARLELIEALLSQAKSPVAQRELNKALNTLWSLHSKQDEW